MRLAPPPAVVAAVVAVVLGTTNTASAGLTTVNIVSSGSQNNSPKTQGKFSGTIEYDWTSATAAALKITLKNTNTVAEEGYLVGFVFNNPGDKVSTATMATTDTYKLYGKVKATDKNNTIDANPFGNFDFFISPDGKFNGGGNGQSGGFSPGVSKTFTIALTGTGLNTLTANTFATTPDDGSGSKTANLLARFQGFKDGGSDKVPGVVAAAVPEPSLMAMGAAGLAGLGFIRRRFGRKAAA
ncbi:MAG: PEP-CTERM sorting domain-containing protein [Gemmataceae bacterium]|nr:PEP-CTERM sorting domain-containing protein [Gemmataceae bacterium]